MMASRATVRRVLMAMLATRTREGESGGGPRHSPQAVSSVNNM